MRKLKLFHGTSTIWIENILRYGLGAKNPVIEYRCLDFLRECVNLCEANYRGKDNPFWSCYGETSKRMVNNTLTAGGFDFRYGPLFLTSDRNRACDYAKNNIYGSELISRCALLYEQLRHDVPSKIPPELIYSPITKLFEMSGRPVLIEVLEVAESDVRCLTPDSVEVVRKYGGYLDYESLVNLPVTPNQVCELC